MNDDDTREAIKRVLHDFVIFRLQPTVTLGELKPLLDKKTEELLEIMSNEKRGVKCGS